MTSSSVEEPSVDEPTFDEPAFDEPAFDEPAFDESPGSPLADEATPPDESATAGSEADEGDQEDEADEGDESTDEEQLFRQSEIAADYVEGLLDVLDVDGDIDELVAGGRPVVEVVEVQQYQRGGGVRLHSLVGQRGATLEALQDLARLAVFRRTGSPSRLLLDIGGYRATRRSELAAVARNAIERVKEHGEPVRLEAMSAFERKCVHDVINATEGVMSESQGEEPNRRIMVHPE